MKRTHFLILSVVILCMVLSADVNAQSSIGTKESARLFVQKFYDWYFGLYTNVPGKKETYPSDVVAIKQKGNYFDAPLRKALMDDARAQAKVDGEIVGLDFDPFLNGQDIGVGYQSGNVKQAGNKFLVDIHNIEKGKSKKAILASELSVVAEVAKVNRHWVFTNFIYPSPDGNGDLLHILRTLRVARGKTTK